MAPIDEMRVTKPMIVTNVPLPSPVLGSPGLSFVVVTVDLGSSPVVVVVVVVEVVLGSSVVLYDHELVLRS